MFLHRSEAICEVKLIIGICCGFWFKHGLESMCSNTVCKDIDSLQQKTESENKTKFYKTIKTKVL